VAAEPTGPSVRVYSLSATEPLVGKIVESGSDWVRVKPDDGGRISKVSDLHRIGGPAIEAIDGTGSVARYFKDGVETPVLVPPGLRDEPAFLARWTSRWEAAGRPEDAWQLYADTLYHDFDDPHRTGLISLLAESDHPTDRIFADAMKSGFGTPPDAPAEGV
jgi:hypothetical protein